MNVYQDKYGNRYEGNLEGEFLRLRHYEGYIWIAVDEKKYTKCEGIEAVWPSYPGNECWIENKGEKYKVYAVSQNHFKCVGPVGIGYTPLFEQAKAEGWTLCENESKEKVIKTVKCLSKSQAVDHLDKPSGVIFLFNVVDGTLCKFHCNPDNSLEWCINKDNYGILHSDYNEWYDYIALEDPTGCVIQDENGKEIYRPKDENSN